MTLHLEYTCTKAERDEAQSLLLRQQLGGGSKWRTWLILFVILAFAITTLYFLLAMRMSPRERPWFIALLIGCVLFVFIRNRIRGRKKAPPARLELFDQGLAFAGERGCTTMEWTAFSQLLESPNLFVLIDRPKLVSFILPRRAFPNEAAQDWFRTRAGEGIAVALPASPPAPEKVAAAQGIPLKLHLKYRDYLDRNLTSWRFKAIAVLVLLFIVGVAIFAPEPPHPVNSRLTVCLIMLPIFAVGMSFIFLVISLYIWFIERKYLLPQQLVVSRAGLEFLGADNVGHMAWSAYQYYRESRWSFYIWKPCARLWMMFPKRAFTSSADLAEFRKLLQTHLKASRWFYY